MDWFSSEDFAQPKVSMDHFREWAGEIANSYFNSGAPPTSTLTKIATSEELAPHQIQLLAAEANKLIHTKKFASVKEKYHAADFPLADAKAAINALQLDTTKVAAQFVPPIIPDVGPDPFEMFGVKPAEMDKTASVRHQLKQASEKAQLLSDKQADRIIFTKSAMESAEQSFIKVARAHCLDEDSSESRMKILGFFDHFVKCAGIPVGRRMLAKVAYVLGKEGKLEPRHAKEAWDHFTKVADETVPDSMISGKLPATIVNGEHPLYLSLKTVGDHEADLLRFTQEGVLTKDRQRAIVAAVKAL